MNDIDFFDQNFLSSIDDMTQQLFANKVASWQEVQNYFVRVISTTRVHVEDGIYVGMPVGVQYFLHRNDCDLDIADFGVDLSRLQGTGPLMLPSHGFLQFDDRYKGKDVFFDIRFMTY